MVGNSCCAALMAMLMAPLVSTIDLRAAAIASLCTPEFQLVLVFFLLGLADRGVTALEDDSTAIVGAADLADGFGWASSW